MPSIKFLISIGFVDRSKDYITIKKNHTKKGKNLPCGVDDVLSVDVTVIEGVVAVFELPSVTFPSFES